jgi:hypothetical protein
VSYAPWLQPEYGAGLRSPDRRQDRHSRTRPRRRGPWSPRRVAVLTLAGLPGLGALLALTPAGPSPASPAPVELPSAHAR